MRPLVSSGAALGPAVAIFHANQSSTPLPPHLSPAIMRGLRSTRLPSPTATRNNSSPIPRTCPTSAGSPRRIPTAAPVDVSSRLLGPGVMAATTAKSKKAMACAADTAELRLGEGTGIGHYAEPA
jgi:hypothetical protein